MKLVTRIHPGRNTNSCYLPSTHESDEDDVDDEALVDRERQMDNQTSDVFVVMCNAVPEEMGQPDSVDGRYRTPALKRTQFVAHTQHLFPFPKQHFISFECQIRFSPAPWCPRIEYPLLGSFLKKESRPIALFFDTAVAENHKTLNVRGASAHWETEAHSSASTRKGGLMVLVLVILA